MELHLIATEYQLPYGISGSHSVTCHQTQVNTPRPNPILILIWQKL